MLIRFPVNTFADRTVYVTATGSKYHYNNNCSGLNNARKIYTSALSSATSRGLQPCNICAGGHTVAEPFPADLNTVNTLNLNSVWAQYYQNIAIQQQLAVQQAQQLQVAQQQLI